jgi:hypothetical protein
MLGGEPPGGPGTRRVGEVHVEQDEIGVQSPRLAERGGAVGRLADHVVALRLEDEAGGRRKVGWSSTMRTVVTTSR